MQVVSALLLVLGLFLFLFKKKSYLYYTVAWITVFPFIINLGIKIQTDSYYNLLAWCNYYNVIVFFSLFASQLLNDKSKKELIRIKQILVVLFVMFAYSIFCANVRNSGIVLNIKYTFSNFSNIFFLLNIYLLKPSLSSVKKTLKFMFYVELFVGIFQLFGFFQYQVEADEGMANLSIVTGTYIRNNIYAEVLSLLFLSLFYFKVKEKSKIGYYYWILTLYVFYIVYESGIRTALVAFVLIYGLLFVMYLRNKPYFKLKIFAFAVVAIVAINTDMKAIMSGQMTYDSQVESSSERQSNLLNIFRDNDYLAEHTTIYYSIYVLSYFSENPIMGPGLLYSNGKKGYGGVVNTSAGNITDATLALYICETGIIGLMLLFTLYYLILYRINKCNLGAYLLFVYLILITITDPGLFFLPNVLILFLLIYYDNFNKNKTLNNEINKRFETLL